MFILLDTLAVHTWKTARSERVDKNVHVLERMTKTQSIECDVKFSAQSDRAWIKRKTNPFPLIPREEVSEDAFFIFQPILQQFPDSRSFTFEVTRLRRVCSRYTMHIIF